MNYLAFPDIKEIEKISLFFIIGRSRSGTTLLRTMLDAHRNVIVPVECTYILQLSRKYNKIKTWDESVIDHFIEDIQKTWLFSSMNIDPVTLRKNLCQLDGSPSYLTVCKAVLFHAPVIFSKENIILAGDKNPSYSIQFKRLYKLFRNNCKYIYIVRDYRDQYISLKNAGVEITDITVSTKRWVNSYKTIYWLTQKNKGNFHFLKYEDLVTQPAEELTKICSFLGLDFDPKMLDFHTHKEDFRDVYSKQAIEGIHQSLLNPINADKTGIWKTLLNKNQTGLADFIAGKWAVMAGYQRSEIKNPVKYLILSMPGFILYYFAAFSEKLLALAPFKLYLKYSGGAYFGSLWNKYLRKH